MVTGVAGKHTKIEKTTASRESGFQLSRYLLWNVYGKTAYRLILFYGIEVRTSKRYSPHPIPIYTVNSYIFISFILW